MSESPPLPGPSAPAPAPVAAPAPSSPTEALATLQGDKQWSADFNGDNGRRAQQNAVEKKSSLLRGEAPTASPVPAKLQAALDDGVSPGRVDTYIPAQEATDYSFTFSNVESIEHATELQTIAQEAAFRSALLVFRGDDI